MRKKIGEKRRAKIACHSCQLVVVVVVVVVVAWESEFEEKVAQRISKKN